MMQIAHPDVLKRLAALKPENQDYVLSRLGWMRPPARFAEGTDGSVAESAGEQEIQPDPGAEERVDRTAAEPGNQGISQPPRKSINPWRQLLGNAADALGGTAHLLFSDKTRGSQQGGEDAGPILTRYMTAPGTTQTTSSLPAEDEQRAQRAALRCQIGLRRAAAGATRA